MNGLILRSFSTYCLHKFIVKMARTWPTMFQYFPILLRMPVHRQAQNQHTSTYTRMLDLLQSHAPMRTCRQLSMCTKHRARDNSQDIHRKIIGKRLPLLGHFYGNFMKIIRLEVRGNCPASSLFGARIVQHLKKYDFQHFGIL